jgi:hypothetical protein
MAPQEHARVVAEAWASRLMVKKIKWILAVPALAGAASLGILLFLGKPWGIYNYSSAKVSPSPLGFTYDNKAFSGLLYSRYPNGQLSRLSFFWKSLSHGKEYYWYENGQIRQSRGYSFGYPVGLNKSWFVDGKPKSISYYKNGNLDGEAWSWHENGQPAAYAKYTEGKEIAFKSFTLREKPFHNLIRKDEILFGFKGDSKCDPINTSRR